MTHCPGLSSIVARFFSCLTFLSKILMTLSLALILAFVLSAIYAAFLALTDVGLWLRQELTWLSVVLGCGLTIGCIAVVDQGAAGMAALFFAATGAPIVVESLARMYRNQRAVQRRQLGRGDGDERR